jgi:protein TonB
MVIRQPEGVSVQSDPHTGSPRRRALARPSTVAIGASIAVHAVIAVYLYNAAFHIPLPAPADASTIVEGGILRILKPEPAQRDRPKTPPNRLHPPAHTDATTTDKFPVDPPKDRLIGDPPATNPLSTGKELQPFMLIDPPKPRRISDPDWLSKPDARAMSAQFPARPLRMGVSGAATISCVVSASGSLGQCTVVKESPSEFGFGAAALKLAKYFRMRPRTEDSEPVNGAVVQIPIKFQVAGG